MVKNKNLKCYDFIKALWNYEIFSEKFKLGKLAIYNIILLLLITIINLISYNKYTAQFSIIGTTTSIFFGTPILLLITFTIFQIFLNAFNNSNKDFWKSFLVFSSITLPFLLLGHLITYFQSLTYSKGIEALLSILIFALLIYYTINLILNYKNYYKTTGYKIIASLILVNLIYITFGIISYLSYLVLNLK